MKFDIISDIHCNAWAKDQQVYWQMHKKSDIAIVAGDISHSKAGVLAPELDRICRAYDEILFVGGNHDEHQFDKHSLQDSYQIQYNEVRQFKNLHALGFEGSKIIGDTAIVGATTWFDMRFVHPTLKTKHHRQNIGQQQLHQTLGESDFHLSTQQIDEIIKTGELEVASIENQIKTLQADPTIKNIIVVTHHVPHQKFVDWHLAPKPTSLRNVAATSTIGNSLCHKILHADIHKKISHWVFGHTHAAKYEDFNDIKYVCNPRGRPGDVNAVEDYRPMMISTQEHRWQKTKTAITAEQELPLHHRLF